MTSTSEPVLEVVAAVRFHYAEQPRVRYEIPAGLALRRGEACCIYGMSGWGKSTLMTLLAALRRLRDGRIRYRLAEAETAEVTTENWDARVGPRLWRRIGFAFQRPELIRALSVGDNLALVAGRAGRNGASLFDADEWRLIAGSRVARISGGQVQRLGLERAFGPEQPLVFLDEPTNNLDRSNRRRVAEFVARCRAERALVVVSHDEDFIRTLGIERVFKIDEVPTGGSVSRVLVPA